MIRLAVRVHREHAELVLAELLELAPSGVEETEIAGDLIEYAVYGPPGELPELPDLRAAAGPALVEIATSELPDDWSERWKQFHRPVLIETPARDVALHVRPPWEPPSDHPGALEIVIDPAQAFGTGAHATTRLCLELLLELSGDAEDPSAAADQPRDPRAEREPLRNPHAEREPLRNPHAEREPLRNPRADRDQPRGPLLDVGTGSGVLAIAAVLLGFGPVVGLDNELESVVATRDNARINRVEIETRHFDLRSDPLPDIATQRAGVVVANLLRPLLLELAAALPVAPHQLLASGLLVHEVDEIVAAFAAQHGLRERERRHSGEWAAVWLTAAPGSTR